MVKPAELLRRFHRHHIAYILHYTNNGRVALRVGTDAASLRIRNIMTHLAVFHFMLQRNDGIAESLHRRRILTQQMKHQSHGRFPAYTRQFGKLIHRFFQ